MLDILMAALGTKKFIAVSILPAATFFVALAWTPTDIALVGGVFVTLVGVVLAFIVNMTTLLRKVEKTVGETAVRVESAAKQTDAVEKLVNSAASKADAENRAQLKELEGLRSQISELKQTAALLAQVAATTAVTGQPLAVPELPQTPVIIVNPKAIPVKETP